MKNRAIILSLLVILLVLQLTIDANREIVLLEKDKMYTILPMNDVPININKQSLSIDNKVEDIGKVTDKYFMKNTSDQKINVPILMPVLKGNNEPKNINILVNNEETKYTIKWLLDSEKYNPEGINKNDKGNIDLENLLKEYEYKKNYKYKNMNPKEKIWVYEINLKDKNNEIKVTNKEEPLKIMYISNKTDKFKMDHNSKSSEFFMNKGTNDKYYIALFDSQLKDITFECNTDYRKREMTLTHYVTDVIQEHYKKIGNKPHNIIMKTEMITHVLHYIDKSFEDDNKNIELNNILKNYIDLVYFSVDFEPNEFKIIKIDYDILGTFNKTKTTEPIYTYKFDLSTKKYWQNVITFEMNILVGESYKYLIESTIPYEFKDNENKYFTTTYNLESSELEYSVYLENINLQELNKISTKKTIKYISIGLFSIIVILGLFKLVVEANKNI